MSTTTDTRVSAASPTAAHDLMEQWRALRAANPRDKARVWDEATATTAIAAALSVAEIVGDRTFSGDAYVAHSVPGAYQGQAWSDAVVLEHRDGEIVLRVCRRDAVRNVNSHEIQLSLRVAGKGAREVEGNARKAFAAVRG